VVAPAAGAVVLVRFPFSDLSQTKLRPAVVLADVQRGDFILCQVTSKPYGDATAIELRSSGKTLHGQPKLDHRSGWPSKTRCTPKHHTDSCQDPRRREGSVSQIAEPAAAADGGEAAIPAYRRRRREPRRWAGHL